MLQRLIILFTAFSLACLGQTSYERLAAAAKLWAYVKYLHPRVTSPAMDWDSAFVRAAPEVLAATSDDEFKAALRGMLAELKDPCTRLSPSTMDELMAESDRLLLVPKTEDGVTIVRVDKGDFMQAMQGRNMLVQNLLGTGKVVFDLRGVKTAQYILPALLPVAKASAGPSYRTRVHSGYSSPDNSGTGGYSSTWQIRQGANLPAAEKPITAVFLVNQKSYIPSVALAMQNSGVGAIVSEEPVGEEQLEMGRPVKVLGKLMAEVRVEELVYPDGTSGFAANVVLNKTGDEALKAAVEIAKSGKWPMPSARTAVDLSPPGSVERAYADQPYPNKEYRILAAARVWAVFHYFHPYRHLYDRDWDAVLVEFLQKMAAAQNAREYHLAIAEMVAHTQDTHDRVTSKELSSFYGTAAPPVELRWIENRPVITRVRIVESISPGDEVTKIDGEPYQKRAAELEKHTAASTRQSMMSRVMQSLLSGDPGSTVRLTVRTGNSPEREVELKRESIAWLRPLRTGEVIRLIKPKIGYVDLERLPIARVDEMFEKLKDTDAIIMDMRGYPQGTAWSIAPRLSEKPEPVAAQFRRNLVMANNESEAGIVTLLFEQRLPATSKPLYRGRTVMLIDERAISQSEHSGLFYRRANVTVFIGSPTTGANGDVTWFTAPGGIRVSFSGHDVRWPDGKQLQRVGLTPDIAAHPTIESIRSGSDEVLERAVAYLENGN